MRAGIERETSAPGQSARGGDGRDGREWSADDAARGPYFLNALLPLAVCGGPGLHLTALEAFRHRGGGTPQAYTNPREGGNGIYLMRRAARTMGVSSAP